MSKNLSLCNIKAKKSPPKFLHKAGELGRTIHTHPTVSESMMEAAEGVHDLTIHM